MSARLGLAMLGVVAWFVAACQVPPPLTAAPTAAVRQKQVLAKYVKIDARFTDELEASGFIKSLYP